MEQVGWRMMEPPGSNMDGLRLTGYEASYPLERFRSVSGGRLLVLYVRTLSPEFKV